MRPNIFTGIQEMKFVLEVFSVQWPGGEWSIMLRWIRKYESIMGCKASLDSKL